MNIRRHAGRVSQDGSLRLCDLSAWRRAIERHKGHDVWLAVQRIADEKTTQDQHGYYRAVILPLLAEEWGWGNPAELHLQLKRLHLPHIIPVSEWPRRYVGREEIVDVPSMADFTKEQTSAFLQAVLDQAQDSNIAVPPPRGSEAA